MVIKMSIDWYKIASKTFYKGKNMNGFPIYRIYNLKDALSFFKLPVYWASSGIPKDFTVEDLNDAKMAIFREYRDINVNTIAQLENDAYRMVKKAIEKND
jgi:hypothetical protein